jgi:hypothetical protein
MEGVEESLDARHERRRVWKSAEEKQALVKANQLLRVREFELRKLTEDFIDNRSAPGVEATLNGFELREDFVRVVKGGRHGRRNSVPHAHPMKLMSLLQDPEQGRRLFQAEAAIEVLDNSIALASHGFQALAIQYLNGTPQVLYQSGIFEDPSGQADAGASSTEHLSKEVVR